MSVGAMATRRLERLLARALALGTWIASGIVALGLAAGILGQALSWGLAHAVSAGVVTAGIAGFILLPVMRVMLMFGVFLRERDLRFAAVAAFVLVIIAAGFAIGILAAPPM